MLDVIRLDVYAFMRDEDTRKSEFVALQVPDVPAGDEAGGGDGIYNPELTSLPADAGGVRRRPAFPITTTPVCSSRKSRTSFHQETEEVLSQGAPRV